MRWLRRSRTFVRALVDGRRLERDMDEELRFHLEQQVSENLASGMEPGEARRRARLTFGGLDSVKEECRDVRRPRRLESVFQDLRYGVRSLAKNPGLVAVSVLSLGLGMGLNFVLYSGLSTILLNRPTMTDIDGVFGVEPGNGKQFSYLNYRDLRESRVAAGLVGFRVTGHNLRFGDEIERVGVLAVTGNFFEELGIGAAVGRTFGGAEAALEREAHIVVLSHGYWTWRFQSDPGIVGRTLTLNGRPFVVVGVLPEAHVSVTGFQGPPIYAPLSRSLLPEVDGRGVPILTVLARLHEGSTPEQVRQAITVLDQALEDGYPERNEGLGKPAKIFPVAELQFRGSPNGFRLLPPLLLLLFGFLLLLACGNVAGLLLARTVQRRHELTIRVALGASRGRVVQLLLIESFLLAVLGSGAGLLLAVTLGRLSPPGPLAMLGQLYAPDLRIVAYAAVLVAVTTLACGVSPALRAMRSDITDRIKSDGRGTTGRMRLRHLFVTGQVAASVTLLVVSSLCLRSQLRVATVDLGFDVDHGVVAQLSLDRQGLSDAERLLFAEKVVDRLELIPGARSVAMASVVPLGRDSLVASFHPAGRTDIPGTRPWVYSVGPRYFETLSIRLLEGREFETSDEAGSLPVVIVSETYAKTYFPGQEALGRRVQTGDEDEALVVGVVPDTKIRTLGEAPKSVLYYPFEQRPRRLVVHLRTDGSPEALVPPVRNAIAALDRHVAADVRTLRSATSLELTMRRSATWLLGAIGGLGLLLAMIGLYGAMTNVVAAQTNEIGIRMALGASAGRLRRAVLAQALKLVSAGIVVGWILSLALAPRLGTFLAGISPIDPPAFTATAIVLILVGMAASYLPARRASRVDPIVALRRD